VSSRDLQDAISEGFDDIEMLKHHTTTTMGPCRGRMCQLSAIHVCASQTHRGMGEIGTTTARPPQPAGHIGLPGRSAPPSRPAYSVAL
jgi:sarcosine oxidase subunit alpha